MKVGWVADPVSPFLQEGGKALAFRAEYKKHSDVACIMLGKMSPALQRQFENYPPQNMLAELRKMFEKPPAVEIYDLVDALHSSRQALVNPSLNKDFGDFVRNFNMHCVGKTVTELHALLIDFEKGLKDKAPTPQVFSIQKVRDNKPKPQANKKVKGKGKAYKNKQVVPYQPKPKPIVWSCAMLLALEGKNKTGFVDETCKRSNTDEVLGKDPLVIVVADTDFLSHMCCVSALSAYALKHPARASLSLGLVAARMEPFPKSTEFNADDYAILVAHPALFQKFPKPFLCLIGMSCNYTLDEDTYPTFLHDDGTEMDLFAFIQVADPTKVKVGERERAIGEARLLDFIVGRVVLLLPVAPARAKSELEASVEKLFNEGGNVDQVDSAVGGGQEAEVGIATGVKIVAEENMAIERPRPAICDKSPSALRELLASILLKVEVGVVAVPTLPMVTSLVSATPEHESGVPSDSITGPNAEGDSFIKSDIVPPVMTEVVVTSHVVDIPPVLEMGVKVTSLVRASLFQVSDSTETVKADIAGPSYFAKQDLSMGSPSKIFRWAPEKFIVGTARQAFLNVEVKMQTEYCLSERKRLKSECEKQADLLKDRDAEIESLKARLLLKETEATEVIHHHAQVSTSEVMEKKHVNEIDALKQKNVALENKKGSLDGKVVELQSLVSTKDLELKELNVVVSSLREGTSLTDVAAYNPFAESDFNSALQELCKLDYPLLFELKSHKDASVEDIMNLLRLKGPHVDAPVFLIPRVEQIKENIVAERSDLLDVWTPLSEPLSVQNLIGEASTSANVPATTTTTLSTTFAYASSIPPNTVDDYEIVHTDGQESPQGNVQGDATTVEFENEDLDATP
nr:hypothetical protein [Tanacetum cinerariifolium]